LALAGITDMAAANRYLTEQFLPQHNERFMVRATEPGTAFIPWVGTSLAEILCVHEARVVAKDNTVRYQGTILQIPQDPHRFHYYVKGTVRAHEYPEGSWPCSMSLGVWRATTQMAGSSRPRARGAVKEGSILEQYVDRLSSEPARRQACRSSVSAVAVEVFVNNAG
jgi:hypothetical protein